MDKARDIGNEVLKGIRALKGGESGRVTRIRSVAQIRESVGLSQQQFARLLGVSIRTLQEWEQGRRHPSGAARSLLAIAAHRPEVLREVFE